MQHLGTRIDQRSDNGSLFGRPCGSIVSWARETRKEREQRAAVEWIESDAVREHSDDGFWLDNSSSARGVAIAANSIVSTTEKVSQRGFTGEGHHETETVSGEGETRLTGTRTPSGGVFARLVYFGSTPEQAMRSLLRRHRDGRLPALPRVDVGLPSECDDGDALIVKTLAEWVTMRLAAGMPLSTPFTAGVGSELTGLSKATFWRRWQRLVQLGVVVETGAMTIGGRATRLWRLAAMTDEVVEELTREMAEADAEREVAEERCLVTVGTMTVTNSTRSTVGSITTASVTGSRGLRRRTLRPVACTCEACGENFEAKQSNRTFCSARCKQSAYRERKAAHAHDDARLDGERERLLRFLDLCFPDAMSDPSNRAAIRSAVKDDLLATQRLVNERGLTGALSLLPQAQ